MVTSNKHDHEYLKQLALVSLCVHVMLALFSYFLLPRQHGDMPLNSIQI